MKKNPYATLINDSIFASQKANVRLWKTWNEKAERMEPTLELFLEAHTEDSVSALTCLSYEWLEHLVKKGLCEDFLSYWQDAKEETQMLFDEAVCEFSNESGNAY